MASRRGMIQRCTTVDNAARRGACDEIQQILNRHSHFKPIILQVSQQKLLVARSLVRASHVGRHGSIMQVEWMRPRKMRGQLNLCVNCRKTGLIVNEILLSMAACCNARVQVFTGIWYFSKHRITAFLRDLVKRSFLLTNTCISIANCNAKLYI